MQASAAVLLAFLSNVFQAPISDARRQGHLIRCVLNRSTHRIETFLPGVIVCSDKSCFLTRWFDVALFEWIASSLNGTRLAYASNASCVVGT